MATIYQERKIAEMKRLGWMDSGRKNLPGAGRAPMEYIYELANSTGLRAFVYPSHTDYLALEVRPVDMLKVAFEELS